MACMCACTSRDGLYVMAMTRFCSLEFVRDYQRSISLTCGVLYACARVCVMSIHLVCALVFRMCACVVCSCTCYDCWSLGCASLLEPK
jgi:hypothetical protein